MNTPMYGIFLPAFIHSRAAIVVQWRVLLAPARVFDPDAGARRRATLGLEDSYRAIILYGG